MSVCNWITNYNDTFSNFLFLQHFALSYCVNYKQVMNVLASRRLRKDFEKERHEVIKEGTRESDILLRSFSFVLIDSLRVSFPEKTREMETVR